MANGVIRISDDTFVSLPDKDKDRAFLTALNSIDARLTGIETKMAWRWKLNAALTLIGSFFGGFVAHMMGGRLPK